MNYFGSLKCSVSSSSSDAIKKYDVFVSFRGEDTGNNFTAFLLQALRRKGINAFKDDENLKKGEFIEPELREAIEGSRIFIVVFSKNYASSNWCLGELAHICYCIETSRRPVLPIFYDVDPLEVRKQSGCYEKAFVEHEERFVEDSKKMKEVHRWREALKQVANFKSGWDIRNKALYAEIEQIVETINYELDSKSCPNDDIDGVSQIFSSFSSPTRPTYDVFVSFCGVDTPNNFTAFLFDALSQNGIHAFKDDTHLQKGESIAPKLLQAIHGSRLFVVVFSKNSASSTWRLRELAHICNCTDEASPSRVIPIFYDVDPSEVRKQSGYYGIAFAKHEE
uniref:ADP-ribosyl cyclase/cyclic ADP-ribose hydrolase n=1 Tax=Glycine max TaxID=3847 RepID=A0A0R0JXY0_SOYBN